MLMSLSGLQELARQPSPAIANGVNPWPLTRDAWQQVGQHRHVRVTASALNGNCRFS